MIYIHYYQSCNLTFNITECNSFFDRYFTHNKPPTFRGRNFHAKRRLWRLSSVSLLPWVPVLTTGSQSLEGTTWSSNVTATTPGSQERGAEKAGKRGNTTGTNPSGMTHQPRCPSLSGTDNAALL